MLVLDFLLRWFRFDKVKTGEVVLPNGFNVKVALDLVSAQFWPQINTSRWEELTWEPTTLSTLYTFIDHDTYFVDFGSWIGPTLLFVGPLAKVSVGIEGDPRAFACLETNLKLNADAEWSRRVHVQNACVGARTELHTMQTLDFANSASAFNVDHANSNSYKDQIAQNRTLHQ